MQFPHFGKFFVGLCGIALSGCLSVVSVNQPATVNQGSNFDVTMVVEVGTIYSGAINGSPLFGVMLPDGWEITSCSYSGDFSGTCTETIDYYFEHYSPAGAGYAWQGYIGEQVDLTEQTIGDLQGLQTTVTWSMRATSSGDFVLGYAAGGYSEHVDSTIVFDVENGASPPGAGANQPIQVLSGDALSGQIHAVPSLSTLGLVMLGLLMGLVTLLQRRR